jgi:hypothetical protein
MDHFAPLSRLATKACACNGAVCHHCGRPGPKAYAGRSYDYACPCGARWRSEPYRLTPAEYTALLSERAS